MTFIDVRDETGQHTDLAGQIHGILTEAAPLVEKESGLVLPPVTYRLVEPDAYAQTMRTYVAGALRRDTAGLKLTTAEQRWIVRYPAILAKMITKAWTVVKPELVTDSILRPDIVIAPAALEHQGYLGAPDALCEQMIRPLAFLAQTAASQGTVIPTKMWPKSYDYPWHPVQVLREGHARWVGDVVTPLVLGRPLTRSRLHRSGLYRRHAGIMTLFDFGTVERKSRQGAHFVAEAVAEIGPILFNRIWSEPQLLPTKTELKNPARWMHRIT